VSQRFNLSDWTLHHRTLVGFLLLAIEEKTSPAQAKADLERLGTFAGRVRPCTFREKKEKPERPMIKSLR